MQRILVYAMWNKLVNEREARNVAEKLFEKADALYDNFYSRRETARDEAKKALKTCVKEQNRLIDKFNNMSAGDKPLSQHQEQKLGVIHNRVHELTPIIAQARKVIEERPDDLSPLCFFLGKYRDDPRLLAAFDAAYDELSQWLAVVEIPDGIRWIVGVDSEYEAVIEEHRKWQADIDEETAERLLHYYDTREWNESTLHDRTPADQASRCMT